MAASYPTSVKSFSAVNDGDVISDEMFEEAYDEITAVETSLLAAWTAPAFSAGDYTGSGSMTWTVASGDVVTLAYRKVGKTMTVSFYINTATVGGTPDTVLLIAIPGGFTALRTMAAPFWYSDGGASTAVGFCTVIASGTTIRLLKVDQSNWTSGTNNNYVNGQITFETTT